MRRKFCSRAENEGQDDKIDTWKYEDRLIGSLARLGKIDEARKELASMKNNHLTNRLLEAVVAARSGDIKATAQALERLKQAYYSMRTIYNDPDLGPLLRSDAFKKLRKKYPEK